MIEHLKTLPPETFKQQMESVFPSISATLGHMLSVDNLWLTRMRQETMPTQMEVYTLEDLISAEKVHARVAERFHTFIQDEKDVTRTIDYRNTEGEPFRQSLFEIIQHVVNHGSYHRGNIAAMIRQLGYKGTSTDYIAFLRLTGKR